MVCDIPVDDIPYGVLETSNLIFHRRMIQDYPIFGSIMVSSPDGLVEEMLGGIGDAIEDRIKHKWWSKILYPFFVLVFLSVPVIYYFW